MFLSFFLRGVGGFEGLGMQGFRLHGLGRFGLIKLHSVGVSKIEGSGFRAECLWVHTISHSSIYYISLNPQP